MHSIAPTETETLMKISLDVHDALLVVDMQNDFLPGGSLAVSGSDAIISVVNSYIQSFSEARLPIFASRDYHPDDHISFLENGGTWPPHCVAGSKGSEFHPELQLPKDTVIISKGTSSKAEAYSALDSTALSQQLQDRGIERVFVCGLATDYCVHASAMDLLNADFSVLVLIDAVKAVNVQPGDGVRALKELTDRGAIAITKDNLIS
jgi:nicotinamidase/pyrazinamidase